MSTSSSEPTPEVPTDAMPAETQTLAEALRVAGWPASLDCASKQPHICQSLDEFEDLVLYGQHIDRIIVLKDGTRRLQQQSALPDNVLDAARGETCVRSFLRRLAVSSPLEELGGRLYCTPEGSRDEKELTKRDGKELTHLADKWAALPEAAPGKSRVYLGELRRRTKYRHPQDGRWAKTLLSRDICDWLGRQRAEAMPYWDRYDEGVFVGATYGGSPLHVDQVNWSNLGKNFLGHKLLAIWKYGQGSKAMFDEHAYSLFTPPLSEAENAALESAAQVALLGPGDIVVFSGGNAHMALSSSASLSLTSYESFVNLSERNLEAFLDSGTKAHYRQCRTRQPTLDDIKSEVADSVRYLVEDLEDGVLRDDALVAAAPGAIRKLRGDPLIARESPALSLEWEQRAARRGRGGAARER